MSKFIGAIAREHRFSVITATPEGVTYFFAVTYPYQHHVCILLLTYSVVDVWHPTLLPYGIVTPVVNEINQSPRDQGLVCFVFIKHVRL